MKKFMAMLLALAMVCALLAACGGKAPQASEPATEAPTEAPVEVPGSALEILETLWALYGEEEKFPVMGGDMNNLVDGAPGSYDVADVEGMSYYFLLPAEQAANVDDAASLLHGMMLNNFTCGVFHVTGDASSFADVMHEAVKNNQWMCGFPDKMLISIIGGEYVLVAYGINDAMGPFQEKLLTAYPDAQIAYDEAVA